MIVGRIVRTGWLMRVLRGLFERENFVLSLLSQTRLCLDGENVSGAARAQGCPTGLRLYSTDLRCLRSQIQSGLPGLVIEGAFSKDGEFL